ncbi:bactofilin family protein [Tenacibaculum aquimarinum]|uniref:bactofilin family protein n=1 Tax=Tenacibaculum aquimarinum TaxID=2910675 RepID=UPI00286815BD|nr:polymer-forming cytoskeletal protein [Tenacibaculum aquimarinum]
MFKKDQTTNEPKKSSERNILAQNTQIIGNITSDGDFRIDGTLEGNLTTDGRVVIGAKGLVKGACSLCQCRYRR